MQLISVNCYVTSRSPYVPKPYVKCDVTSLIIVTLRNVHLMFHSPTSSQILADVRTLGVTWGKWVGSRPGSGPPHPLKIGPPLQSRPPTLDE